MTRLSMEACRRASSLRTPMSLELGLFPEAPYRCQATWRRADSDRSGSPVVSQGRPVSMQSSAKEAMELYRLFARCKCARRQESISSERPWPGDYISPLSCDSSRLQHFSNGIHPSQFSGRPGPVSVHAYGGERVALASKLVHS